MSGMLTKIGLVFSMSRIILLHLEFLINGYSIYKFPGVGVVFIIIEIMF